MEKFFVRAFGIIWIAMIVFLVFVIARKPSESGMAVAFLFLSVGMIYCHFSGQFDPNSTIT